MNGDYAGMQIALQTAPPVACIMLLKCCGSFVWVTFLHNPGSHLTRSPNEKSMLRPCSRPSTAGILTLANKKMVWLSTGANKRITFVKSPG